MRVRPITINFNNPHEMAGFALTLEAFFSGALAWRLRVPGRFGSAIVFGTNLAIGGSVATAWVYSTWR
jgi:ABC-type sulfate transport system permease component